MEPESPKAQEVTPAPPPPEHENSATLRQRLRPAGWALGLPVLALLVAVAAMRISPAIEINIRREAAKLVRGGEESPLVAAGGRVVVAGRDVRIVTDADLSDELRADVERRARALPGVRMAGSEVTGYVALSPFAFRVKRTESGIELSGGVPTTEVRASLVAQAARFVPADLVEDRLRLAAGAPPGFAAAAGHLLETIAPIDSAEGTLTDRRVQANASPRDPAAYNTVMAALRALPTGYVTGELEILPPRITPFIWTASRDDAGIALGGAVPSEDQRAALVRLAKEMLPDLPVRDSMQTARGLDRSVDLMATARAAFDSLNRLKRGEARLTERSFSLTGDTVAKGGGEAVAKQLRETLPSALGSPTVSVSVVPASPFLFSAKRIAGRLELTGYLSDDRDRASATSLAAARFPGERVLDRLIVVEGAPEGFPDVLRTALTTLSDFAEGEAAIRDRELTYSGRILYGQLAARVRRTAPSQVPAGWQARVDLAPVSPRGAIDAYLCGDLLSDASRRNPVRFTPGQTAPAPNSVGAIEAAADIVRRCGHVGIRIVHHVGAEGGEAARELAAGRARALVTALSERGATARLSAEGVASAADKGAERNEFHVTPL